ncbi:hypothetical protein ACOMHN_022185 [Nucella lapillus]
MFADPTNQYFSSTSRILASPGAGTISRSLTHRLHSSSSLTPTPTTTRGERPPTRHTTSPTRDPDKELAKDFHPYPPEVPSPKIGAEACSICQSSLTITIPWGWVSKAPGMITNLTLGG